MPMACMSCEIAVGQTTLFDMIGISIDSASYGFAQGTVLRKHSCRLCPFSQNPQYSAYIWLLLSGAKTTLCTVVIV